MGHFCKFRLGFVSDSSSASSYSSCRLKLMCGFFIRDAGVYLTLQLWNGPGALALGSGSGRPPSARAFPALKAAAH